MSPTQKETMTQREQWQMAGTGPESYERHLVPALFKPWALDLLARANLCTGERVLDVACGTGIAARLAAETVGPPGSVWGIDLNTAMIEVARAHAPAIAARIEWRVANATALPCLDASFDAVLCQQGLQFFPEQAVAVREMHRVLVPGGRLVLSVWRSLPFNPYVSALADALERHLGAESGAAMRAPCGFGDLGALRELLVNAGLACAGISIAVQVLRHIAPAAFIAGQLAASPLAGAVATLDAAARSALIDDILASLKPYTDDGGLAVPMQAHVAVAKK
jgi:2-polyprenyl-3-methyl-5-hydroxy-6-metoxy-1,4-benzoquinol methylase